MWLLNEWRYIRCQPLFWLACFCVLSIAWLFATGISTNDMQVEKQLQSLHMTLLMMVVPLLSGALAPAILLRDQLFAMHELIGVCPPGKTQRLLHRFVMLVVAQSLLMLLAFMLIYLLVSSDNGFSVGLLALTVWDIILLAWPASLFFSALALWLCQRMASSAACYMVFSLFWLAYLTLASMTGSPMLAGSHIVSPWLFETMRWLDPFGITAMVALYQQSTIAYLGDAVFYLNRFGICLAAFAVVKASLHTTPRHSRRVDKQAVLAQTDSNIVSYAGIVGRPSAVHQIWQLFRVGLGQILRQRLNQCILLLWVLLLFNETLSSMDYAEPLAVLTATSRDALNRVSADLLPLLGSLLVLFWSWQLCWRDRQTGIAELIASTPLRSGLMPVSQLLILSTLIMLLLLLCGLSISVAELLANSQWQLAEYTRQLGLLSLPMLLLAAMFIALHHLCRSPLVAAAWCIGILFMKFSPLSVNLGLSHTLWKIADSPLQPADAFWGYQQSLSVYWPFMRLWLVLSVSLLVLASLYSHRGTALRNVQRRQPRFAALACIVFSAAMIVQLHQQIIAERPLYNSDLREQWRADYEHSYAKWANMPQPDISHIEAKVDFYPEQGIAELALQYQLENRTQHAISQLLIGHDSATPLLNLGFSRQAQSEYDSALQQYVVTLAQPLLPGEQLNMHSELHFVQPKLWPAVMHQWVKPALSYLRSVKLLPTVGFQTVYTLRDPSARQQHGLAALDNSKPSELFANQSAPEPYQWLTLHSTVSTKAGQIPLAQGSLVRQWQDKDREYREYRTVGPLRNALAWYSLTGSVLEEQHDNIQLKVFTPTLNAAAQLNMQAMHDTLSWMEQHIAPYRASNLNLLTMPDIGAIGYALPQMLMISHRIGFRARPAANAGFDQRYRRAVHETAHQWFGHDIGNGVLQDSSFLVESLAKYVELVVIEQHYGESAMQALVDYERQRYQVAEGRSQQKPVALIDATESHDTYSRATLVFARLRAELGDEPITAALRSVWQQHAFPNPPATSMDFVRALNAQLDPAQQAVAERLLLGTDMREVLSK